MKHSDIVNDIKKSVKGTGLTVPLSHKKFNSNVSLSRGIGVLFGGEPGTGKTAIVDSLFVLEIYDTWKNQETKTFNPYWIYRSMERPEKFKRAKWICYKLWKDYRILCDVPTLLSWQNKMYTISDELISIVASYADYYDEMSERVYIISGSDSYIGIGKVIHNEMLKYGKTHQVDENRKVFEYANEKDIIFHITDHIGKIKRATGQSTSKEAIDAYSRFMSNDFRDFYNGVYIDISQLNRNIASMDRMKLTDLDVKPEDFKESGEPYENADLVVGCLNPYKRGLETYPADGGYNIARMVDANGKNRFRSIKIIKNSYGSDDLRTGYRFLGENGHMVEQPKPNDMTDRDYNIITLNGYQLDSKYYQGELIKL